MTPPRGVILHGSRSGRASNSTEQEFIGTSNFAANTDLGWHATIGPDKLAIHMGFKDWGWNARQASYRYLAVEFSQPLESHAINDDQVRAFAYWYQLAKLAWPTLPLHFPTHAELDGTVEYGGFLDGKSDVVSKNSPRSNELRQRILAHIEYFKTH